MIGRSAFYLRGSVVVVRGCGVEIGRGKEVGVFELGGCRGTFWNITQKGKKKKRLEKQDEKKRNEFLKKKGRDGNAKPTSIRLIGQKAIDDEMKKFKEQQEIKRREKEEEELHKISVAKKMLAGSRWRSHLSLHRQAKREESSEGESDSQEESEQDELNILIQQQTMLKADEANSNEIEQLIPSTKQTQQDSHEANRQTPKEEKTRRWQQMIKRRAKEVLKREWGS
ncbi:uncharacterized protein MONOS_17563 [Monocercomonoides exilis]|uniref:uncharacterized protein n=1 Tax=Monocercomonoides exilis TaxID=2049356 RepID=UPI00355A3BE6|nr:hypothetical protein MONOS_17563 [Monocercomonoides exilis]